MTVVSLGGEVIGRAAIASWGGDEAELFAVQADGQVWNRYWDGSSWHPWESLGGAFSGPIAASARDADRIDVFAVSGNGELMHRFWDGSEWVPWNRVDAEGKVRDVDCSWSTGRLELTMVDDRGVVHHTRLR